jgi:hypothetical protein
MNDPADALAFRPATVERVHVSKHAAGRTKPLDRKTKERRRRLGRQIVMRKAMDEKALREALDG